MYAYHKILKLACAALIALIPLAANGQGLYPRIGVEYFPCP